MAEDKSDLVMRMTLETLFGPDYEHRMSEMGADWEHWLKANFPSQELLARIFEPIRAVSDTLTENLKELAHGLPLSPSDLAQRRYDPIPEWFNIKMSELHSARRMGSEREKLVPTEEKPQPRIGFRP